MPHVIVQASPNVPIKQPKHLLKALNQCLWASGHFKQPEDIKARILTVKDTFVGINDDLQSQGFVYIQLKIMPGRSGAIKKDLADALLRCAQDELTPASKQTTRVTVQFCVEVEELSPSYQKTVITTP